jgi:hypothetical protein
MLGALAVAVAATLAGGIAWAAIPNAQGVVQGCYDGGGNVKVVSALPCPKNYTPFAFLGTTAKAADSDKLDGLDSTAFLGATGKAADSDKLDGIDSTGFVRGRGGETYRFYVDQTGAGCCTSGLDMPLGQILLQCSNDDARYTFRRLSFSPGGPTVRVFDQVNGNAPTFYTADLGFGGVGHNTDGSEHGTFALANADGDTAEIDVWAHFLSPGNCEFIASWNYGEGP